MKSASGKRRPGEKQSPGEETDRPQQCSEAWGRREKRCPRHSALTERVRTAQIQKIISCDAEHIAQVVQRTLCSESVLHRSEYKIQRNFIKHVRIFEVVVAKIHLLYAIVVRISPVLMNIFQNLSTFESVLTQKIKISKITLKIS